MSAGLVQVTFREVAMQLARSLVEITTEHRDSAVADM